MAALTVTITSGLLDTTDVIDVGAINSDNTTTLTDSIFFTGSALATNYAFTPGEREGMTDATRVRAIGGTRQGFPSTLSSLEDILPIFVGRKGGGIRILKSGGAQTLKRTS